MNSSSECPLLAQSRHSDRTPVCWQFEVTADKYERINAALPLGRAPRLIYFAFRKYEIVPARSVSSISWKRLSLPR